MSKATQQIMKSYAVKACNIQQKEIERMCIRTYTHYWNNAVDSTDCWRIHTPDGKFYDASPELVRKAPLGSTLRWWSQQDGGKTISYRKIAGDVWLDVYKREGVEYNFLGRI